MATGASKNGRLSMWPCNKVPYYQGFDPTPIEDSWARAPAAPRILSAGAAEIEHGWIESPFKESEEGLSTLESA